MTTSAALTRAREEVLRLCRDQADARALRLEVLSVLRRAIGFDAYVWLLTDPETSVGSAPLADVPCLPELPRLIRLKYLTPVNRWTAMITPVASLHQATGGDLARSLVWRDMLRQYQVGDIATSVHRDRFGCWAFLDLWRAQQAPPFGSAELELLRDLAGPLSTALRHAQAAAFAPAEPSEPASPGPVVLLLSPELDVLAQTPQTQRYLRLLVPPETESQAPVPAGAYNVGAQLLAREAGVDANPPSARVHLHGGRWLSLRAARLDEPRPVAERDIAVTIETAGPRQRVDLFARASGLTARETQLLDHVVTGAGTRDIARLMFLSEHTVQDHLKSIFAKTSSRTRRILAARVLGTLPTRATGKLPSSRRARTVQRRNQMPRTDVQIPTRDGVARGSLHVPEGQGPWPGVVLFVDAFGLREVMREMGDQLASYGYVVLIPDVFYREGDWAPFDPATAFTDEAERNRLFALIGSLTNDRIIADADAYADFLLARPEVSSKAIGTTGYCMGGRMSMVAAGGIGDKIAAAAAFHAAGIAVPDDPNSPHLAADRIRAAIYVGGSIEDAGFTDEMAQLFRDSLASNGVEHTVEFYPGHHGFAVRDNAPYDPALEQRHWAALQQLYAEHLA